MLSKVKNTIGICVKIYTSSDYHTKLKRFISQSGQNRSARFADV